MGTTPSLANSSIVPVSLGGLLFCLISFSVASGILLGGKNISLRLAWGWAAPMASSRRNGKDFTQATGYGD